MICIYFQVTYKEREMDNSCELMEKKILAHSSRMVLYSNWMEQGEWSEEWWHDQIDPHWRKKKFISAQEVDTRPHILLYF